MFLEQWQEGFNLTLQKAEKSQNRKTSYEDYFQFFSQSVLWEYLLTEKKSIEFSGSAWISSQLWPQDESTQEISKEH